MLQKIDFIYLTTLGNIFKSERNTHRFFYGSDEMKLIFFY